jgi:TolB-like protein
MAEAAQYMEESVVYRFADFHVDLARQELRRDGEPVRVEPQVFDLLVHLIRHRDRIVSKDELIEKVWNGRIVSEAALSSRINGVRRVLGDDGNAQRFVRTLHKRGFRFVGDVDELPPARADDAAPASANAPPAAAAVPIGGGARASIAALPFANLTGEPKNDHFTHSITEDLSGLLARNRWLTVVSAHSTRAVDGRALAARALGESLGVRYIVPGSVRRIGERARITAELVRTADGVLLWAESHDLKLTDISGAEEEMAAKIAATIESELARVEQEAAARKQQGDLDAWGFYHRALRHLWSFTADGFDRADELFGRAIAIDPELARAYAGRGYVNVQRALYAAPERRCETLETALRLAHTAVALDERDAFCRAVLGRALSLQRRNAEASAQLAIACELNPSFAQAYFAQGFNLVWMGQEVEADILLDRAARLSPRDAHLWSFHHVRAWAHFALGEYELAAEYARRAARQPNATYRAYATLASALGQLASDGASRAQAWQDRPEMAAVTARLMRQKPDYTTTFARREFFFCNEETFVDRFVGGLRRAGIAE